jgi:putative transposase
MRRKLVQTALEMAVARRRPARGVIHHSDHAGQCTAVVFGERCAQAGVTVSIGSVGDCDDNAVCEALHATLKRELVNRRSWPTQAEAQTAVFGYIEGFYNTRRRHSTLDHRSPAEHERIAAQLSS